MFFSLRDIWTPEEQVFVIRAMCNYGTPIHDWLWQLVNLGFVVLWSAVAATGELMA